VVPLQTIRAITSDGLKPRDAASSVAPIAPLSGLPASLPRTPSDSSEAVANRLEGH
jgi:hypothetical protein